MISDESQRLHALRQYEILDTLPEGAFDDLVQLAAEICEVPIALMSLVDADRQWFKASVGLAEKETPRSVAFCAHAILGPNLFVVPDAATDERFARNPLVTEEPHFRFYAGAPLQSAEGLPLGTICVLDRVPRTLTPFQQRALRVLGNQVQAQLELRRRLREITLLERQRDELRSFVVHDLKNVIAMIMPNTEFVAEGQGLNADERAAVADIQTSGERISLMVREILDSESLSRGQIVVRPSHVDLCALVREVERIAVRRVEVARRRVSVATPPAGVFVSADGSLLQRVIENLLDNGLKYGAAEVLIGVESPADGQVRLTVSDDGSGVATADRERVFGLRSRLDWNGAVNGHGIGLAFCRAAVEAHGGRIWVEDHQPTGAAFVMQLPHA